MGKRPTRRVGPFDKAKHSVEALAANLYFNTLYMQTLEQLQKVEKEYEAAVLYGDDEIIARTHKELLFIEEIMKLSALNYDIEPKDSDIARDFHD